MTSISGANKEHHTYDAVIHKTFSRIHRRPSRQDRDQLHKEVEHVLVDIRVPNFIWSGRYVLLVEARTKTAYKELSGLVYKEPKDNKHAMANPDITKFSIDYGK